MKDQTKLVQTLRKANATLWNDLRRAEARFDQIDTVQDELTELRIYLERAALVLDDLVDNLREISCNSELPKRKKHGRTCKPGQPSKKSGK